MPPTFFDVTFNSRDIYGLGLANHKLSYSVLSGQPKNVDCCVVTYSKISQDVRKGDILISVKDIPVINSTVCSGGHLEMCSMILHRAEAEVTKIRFLRPLSAFYQALSSTSDPTTINFSLFEASLIYDEEGSNEGGDGNDMTKNKSSTARTVLNGDIARNAVVTTPGYSERKIRENVFDKSDMVTRKRQEHQDGSTALFFNHVFPGAYPMGLNIAPQQLRCFLSSGECVAIGCSVVTDSSFSSKILPGDIIVKINGINITEIIEDGDEVSIGYFDRAIRIISTAKVSRNLDFLRPTGSNNGLPAGLNLHLTISLTDDDQSFLFDSYSPLHDSVEGKSEHDTKIFKNDGEATSSTIHARFRHSSTSSLGNPESHFLNSESSISEEEEISRRVAAEKKIYVLEEEYRTEQEEIRKVSEAKMIKQVAVDLQKFIKNQNMSCELEADRKEKERLLEEELKSVENALQAKIASNNVQYLLEEEVRKRVSAALIIVEEENTKNAVIIAAKEAANKSIENDRKLLEIRLEVEEEKERLKYVVYLKEMEAKVEAEKIIDRMVEEERLRLEMIDMKEAEDNLKRIQQLERNAAFHVAQKRISATAVIYSLTFQNPGSLGIELKSHCVTYTDLKGYLQEIDCCMVVSSKLTEDISSGDILLSVNDVSLTINRRGGSTAVKSSNFLKSVMDIVMKAHSPRTLNYYRLPFNPSALESDSMNSSLTDALLLLLSE